jgi:hypothetical protein
MTNENNTADATRAGDWTLAMGMKPGAVKCTRRLLRLSVGRLGGPTSRSVRVRCSAIL